MTLKMTKADFSRYVRQLLEKMQAERDRVSSDFERDLERYRELTRN